MRISAEVKCLGRNGNFDFDTGLDVDDDLLHDLGWRIEVDQTLVDPVMLLGSIEQRCLLPQPSSANLPHLEHIPRLATFTTWRLSGRDLEVLGR